MVRRKRDFAILVLRCAIVGVGASAQQAAHGMEMVISSKPAIEVIQEAVSSNVSLQSSGMRLPESNDAPPAPLILAQADPVAPVSQAVGGNSLGVQETKNANVPAEPQAVMREIKSATRLSSSKQRRRKPKMAGVPTGLPAVAQEIKEPAAQAVVQGIKEPGAQAVVQEKEEAGTPEETLAATQETKKTLVYPAPKAEVAGVGVKKAGKKYGMAPIRWGGSITETVGHESLKQTCHGVAGSCISSESSGVFNTFTADVKATTYIVQPYVAQLRGNVGVTNLKNSFDNTGSSNTTIGGTQSIMNPSSGSNELFGSGLLRLFPQSRFPFSMGLGVTKRSATSEFDTENSKDKYLFLQQAYQPLGKNTNYNIGHERNIQTFSGSNANQNGTVSRTSWDGGMSTNTQEQSTVVKIKYKDKVASSIDNSTRRTDNLLVNHSYLPVDSLLTLQSIVNLNLFGVENFRSRYLLANTHASWQPEAEDVPLFVDGSAYLLNEWINQQDNHEKKQSMGGNVGATYRFSKNVTGRADGSVTQTRDSNGRILIMGERGNVTYISDATKLWKSSSYSWNANGGASSTNTINDTKLKNIGNGVDRRILGGIGHLLSIPSSLDIFGKKRPILSSINQQLSAQTGEVVGASATLLNSGTVRLMPIIFGKSDDLIGGYGRTDGLSTAGSLMITDQHTYGQTPSHKRTYALALNESSRSAYSRKGLEFEARLGADQGTGGSAIYATGIATYTQLRVFNVRGLDYKGTLKVSRQANTLNRAVNSNANNPAWPWVFDQALTYTLGQNQVVLRSYIADQQGVKNASLWLLFRAWRNFGDY